MDGDSGAYASIGRSLNGKDAEVRVGFMRILVERLHEMPDGARQEVIARIGADVIEGVESAPVVGWLPADVNFRTVEALTAVVGREGTDEFHVTLYETLWEEAAFLRPLIQGVMRVGGRDPGTYLKQLPRGYPLIFRNFGRWSVVERQAASIELELHGAPPRCFAADGSWLRCVVSSMGTIFPLARREGRGELVSANAGTGRARFRFAWS